MRLKNFMYVPRQLKSFVKHDVEVKSVQSDCDIHF